MIRRPPRSTRTDTLFPYTTLFRSITLLGGITLGSCSAQKNESPGSSIERLDAGLDSVIDPNAYVEIIGKGFNWSEGPLWVEQDNMLLFSDVLENKIYRSEEHTSELQSLMRTSYAVFCLKKKTK